MTAATAIYGSRLRGGLRAGFAGAGATRGAGAGAGDTGAASRCGADACLAAADSSWAARRRARQAVTRDSASSLVISTVWQMIAAGRDPVPFWSDPLGA